MLLVHGFLATPRVVGWLAARLGRSGYCAQRVDVALLEGVPSDVPSLATVYDRLQPWNFSHGFLARAPDHLVVTRADDLGWSDWGTPGASERSFAAIGVVPPWRKDADAA
jgi:hypothetical protein